MALRDKFGTIPKNIEIEIKQSETKTLVKMRKNLFAFNTSLAKQAFLACSVKMRKNLFAFNTIEDIYIFTNGGNLIAKNKIL